jgi:hypothetical protein
LRTVKVLLALALIPETEKTASSKSWMRRPWRRMPVPPTVTEAPPLDPRWRMSSNPSTTVKLSLTVIAFAVEFAPSRTTPVPAVPLWRLNGATVSFM